MRECKHLYLKYTPYWYSQGDYVIKRATCRSCGAYADYGKDLNNPDRPNSEAGHRARISSLQIENNS